MQLKKDGNYSVVQSIVELGTTSKTNIATTASSIVATLGSDAVRITANADCCFKFGLNNTVTAAATDHYLPQGRVEYLHAGKATHLAAISVTTSTPPGTFFTSDIK